MSRKKIFMKYKISKNISSTNLHIVLSYLAITLLVLFSVSTIAFAKDSQKTYDELLSEGLLLNHTITPIGQRFYKDFVANWSAPKDLKDYTIVITERFNPQWGSIVWISVDDNVIFQRSLSARNVLMEDLIQQAVSTVERYLFQREILKKLQISNDLKGDGL
jgi:hypothetical protein